MLTTGAGIAALIYGNNNLPDLNIAYEVIEPREWGSEFFLPNSGFTWSHAHADTNKIKQLMNGMGLKLNVDYKITVDMFTTSRRIKILLKPGLESIESAILLQWPRHGKSI